MDKKATSQKELIVPKFIIEGYSIFDERENKWTVKPDAPAWAVEEAKEFYKKLEQIPDENGIVTQY